MLKATRFNNTTALLYFVNKSGLKKEQIVQITESDKGYTLFYYQD
jgi:hypothetical protein